MKLLKVHFRTCNYHQMMPVNSGILIYVPHIVLWRPSGGSRPGGRRHHQHGGVHHDREEHVQLHVWHHYQNTSIQGGQIRHYEDKQKVFSDNKDMEEFIMYMKNIFNIMCGTILETPASKVVRFIIVRINSRYSVTTRTWGSSLWT